MKQTYSKPSTIWNPDLEGTTKQIASSAREISHLKLIASGGSAHVDLYDNRNGQANPTDLVWALDASTTADDDNDFANPLLFSKGIYAVLTQGAGFNPQFCIAHIPSSV